MKKVNGVVKMTKSTAKKTKSSKKTASEHEDTKQQNCEYAGIMKSIDDLLRLYNLQSSILNHLKKRLERLKSR